MAKSKPDLLDEIDGIGKSDHYRSWLAKLTPEEQRTLLDIRTRWQSGHYEERGIKKIQIFNFLKAKMPALTVTLQIFRGWLNDKAS